MLDVRSFCNFLGVALSAASGHPPDGFLCKAVGSTLIVYNPRSSSVGELREAIVKEVLTLKYDIEATQEHVATLLLPYKPFYYAARKLEKDVDKLADKFKVTPELIEHELSTEK